jgi:hypothetical protein
MSHPQVETDATSREIRAQLFVQVTSEAKDFVHRSSMKGFICTLNRRPNRVRTVKNASFT